jgi:hypothetical protein
MIIMMHNFVFVERWKDIQWGTDYAFAQKFYFGNKL